jgi:SAM-dependent methyltransferase
LSDGEILRDVSRYYDSKLREFGPTARGVDWNGKESQERRFAQLMRVLDEIDIADSVEIADIGCGYGALIEFLRKRTLDFRYVGYDVSTAMVTMAKSLFGERGGRVRFVQDWDAVPKVDVAVASGVFNVRLTYSDDVWREYVLDMLLATHAKVRCGWAANFLTIYSDADRMRSNLYYADPGFLFDWCKHNLARDVALLHDYGLYEFTLIVRNVPRGCRR